MVIIKRFGCMLTLMIYFKLIKNLAALNDYLVSFMNPVHLHILVAIKHFVQVHAYLNLPVYFNSDCNKITFSLLKAVHHIKKYSEEVVLFLFLLKLNLLKHI